jgi:hypothetical protein
MRLGKMQTAGYVEDTEVAVQAEVLISDTERVPVAAEPEPAVTAG